jgi:repressor LexA
MAPADAWTEKQGQYLTFIHLYTKLNRQAPSEADMQRYFEVTPPSVHRMVIELERKGFISRVPRTPRSIRVLIEPDALPPLK